MVVQVAQEEVGEVKLEGAVKVFTADEAEEVAGGGTRSTKALLRSSEEAEEGPSRLKPTTSRRPRKGI